MSLPPHSRDIGEYGSVLRRRRLVVTACLLAGVGGGAAALAATPARYTAVAQVQVLPTGVQEQLNTPSTRQREPLNLDTESQVARSAVVSALAARTLKYQDPEELREHVMVDVPPNSAVLSISYTAYDAGAAAAGAQAYAEAYLRNRARSAEDALAAQLKLISARLRQVEDDLDEAAGATQAAAQTGQTARTAGQADPTARLGAARRQAVLARQVSDLTLRYDALRTVAVTPGTVISPARPPARPGSPSPPLYLGSGLFLGILAGAGAAFARDHTDRRLRTCADVERMCGLPLLAELPVRPDPEILGEMAATVATSLGGGPHRLLVEGVGTDTGPRRSGDGGRARRAGADSGARRAGADGAARQLARGLGAALAHLVPVTVVTGRAAHPDAALLLVGLRRTTSTEVTRAVRQLGRQGARVLGVVTVPQGFTPPVPEPVTEPTRWSA
ncbi:Wzz/FepE/Etk N-terminal domain-containing protein [Microbispora sp. H10670]|uniref:Wzz/FepE/Etk N-terminal domain-containing protein n=1 Tax=Microbispora sp. H10670 TaxID=2729108 RepID=UPI001602CA80|nr:Wzz/FepE/Etk N-terminal domain-containing protein [Microbispora sp. H10670]